MERLTTTSSENKIKQKNIKHNENQYDELKLYPL